MSERTTHFTIAAILLVAGCSPQSDEPQPAVAVDQDIGSMVTLPINLSSMMSPDDFVVIESTLGDTAIGRTLNGIRLSVEDDDGNRFDVTVIAESQLMFADVGVTPPEPGDSLLTVMVSENLCQLGRDFFDPPGTLDALPQIRKIQGLENLRRLHFGTRTENPGQQ